jgi:hypothetical protein
MRRRTGLARTAAAGLLVLTWSTALGGGDALAQQVISPVEELAFDRPEAWAMNWVSSVTVLSRMGPAERREPWSLEAGLELGWIPELSARQRTVGFGGLKEEDLNQVPVFVRPRLTVGLPGGFAATVGLVPPVEISGVETEQLALGIDRPFDLGGGWGAAVRVFAAAGSSKGSFTCTADDARFQDDFERNPFGCRAPSNDEATLRSAGLELAGSYTTARDVAPYLAASINVFDNEFQVDAFTFEIHDRSRLEVDGSAWALTGGVGLPLGRGARLAAEAYYAPLPVDRRDAPREDDPLLNARVLLSYRWR